MPAEITNTNGRDEMFYTGKTPWHGLGTKLDGPATAAEAIAAASLDWTVEMMPVYLGGSVEIPGKKAVVRGNNGLVMNVMSDRYTPLQNVDAFAFFDAVVGAGEAIYHTAGSLQGGRKVWALAKLPGDIKITGDDMLEKYVLLANSHDGSLAVTMQLTAVRVVCSNTISVALGSGQKFRALHTPNVSQKANEAREFLGLTEPYFENLMAGINQMVNTKMKEPQVEEMVFKIFGLGRVHTKRSASKMSANEMNPRKITSSFSKREKMRRNGHVPSTAGTASLFRCVSCTSPGRTPTDEPWC